MYLGDEQPFCCRSDLCDYGDGARAGYDGAGKGGQGGRTFRGVGVSQIAIL